ncbi:MAG: hypothetical protein RIG77_00585 [Cyclobacteriaceae bacterium]
MEFIQPAEISGKIMTLIDQAKVEVILISPYNKFAYWKKLTQRIDKAKRRGIKIKWYIRKNVDNNVEQIREIGIEPIEIENLHCKIYLNEQNAVVTSMNLHEYSDTSSIDIGYLITQEDKYKELRNFIDIYIDRSDVSKSMPIEKSKAKEADEKSNFIDAVKNFYLDNGFDKEEIKFHENKYGTVVSLDNFINNFKLILEPKRVCYRIDLRINYPYKVKSDIYNHLKERKDELENLIGLEIAFGNQMKRLKLDMQVFENYEYKKWNCNEFNILKPILIRLNDILREYIGKVV